MPTTDDYDKAQEQSNIEKEKEATRILVSTFLILGLTVCIIIGFILYIAN